MGPKSTLAKKKLAKKKEGEAVASKESSGESTAEAKPKPKPKKAEKERQDRDQQRRLNARPRYLLGVLSFPSDPRPEELGAKREASRRTAPGEVVFWPSFETPSLARGLLRMRSPIGKW